MNIHIFNPAITLSRYRHCNGGETYPVKVGIRHIAEVHPKARNSGSEVFMTVNGAWTPADEIWDVRESPEKIADLICGAVARWHLENFEEARAKSAKSAPESVPNPRGQDSESVYNIHKEAQSRFATSELERIDREISAIYDAAMNGDHDPTAWTGTPAGNIEIPGKDATRPKGAARCLHCGDYVHLPEHDCPFHPLRNLPYTGFPPTPDRIEAKGEPVTLEGVSEAGDDRYKYAEGTGTVSMGKLREALGALQRPGAQIAANGMAATKFGGPMPPVGKCSFCGGAHLSEDHTALGYLGRNEPAPDRIEAQALSYELPKDPVGVAPEYEQGIVAVRRSAKNNPSVGLEYFDAACAVWRPIVHPREQFERAAFSLWSGH